MGSHCVTGTETQVCKVKGILGKDGGGDGCTETGMPCWVSLIYQI